MTQPIQIADAKFTFDCPDCGKQVNFQEALKEETIKDDVERISIVCPYCGSLEVGYYSNNRIRNNIRQLRLLRESNLPDRASRYFSLQEKHKKYFDRFNKKMKSEFGENGTKNS